MEIFHLPEEDSDLQCPVMWLLMLCPENVFFLQRQSSRLKAFRSLLDILKREGKVKVLVKRNQDVWWKVQKKVVCKSCNNEVPYHYIPDDLVVPPNSSL